jgi:hypothetical protein
VVDAGALNLIAADASLASALAVRTAATVITPHPAEAARLLQCDTGAIQGDRVDGALRLAVRFNAARCSRARGACSRSSTAWAVNAGGGGGERGDVLSGTDRRVRPEAFRGPALAHRQLTAPPRVRWSRRPRTVGTGCIRPCAGSRG